MGDLELEDVDLAGSLSRLSKLAAHLAADMFTGLDTPERAHEVADVLAEAERLVRQRAYRMAPKVIDGDAVDALTEDDRLAAALAFLLYQLALTVQQARNGVLSRDERDEVADALTAILRNLRRVELPDDTGDSGGR